MSQRQYHVRLDARAEADLLRMGQVDPKLWDAAWATLDAMAEGEADPDDQERPWRGPWRLQRGRHGTVTYRIKFRPLLATELAGLGPPDQGYLVLRINVRWG